MNQYFPNRDGECFTSSLANAILVEFNDRETASKIYEKSNILMQDNGGTLVTTWPYLVAKLSDHKYQGRLHILPDSIQVALETALEKFSSRQIKLYEKVMVYEQEKENIVTGTSFEIQEPTILCLHQPEGGHAMVHLGADNYIDNGVEKIIDLDPLQIQGVLKVIKRGE